MSKVYTRTGDKGETSLVSGKRILKSEVRINLYGDVDELNSHIGYLISLSNVDTKALVEVQSALFNLGSKLACESEFWEKYKLPDISENLVKTLENAIDQMDKELRPLKNFILPGGSPAGSYAHVARTVCRRVERELVLYLDSGNQEPPRALELINRLSDYLFIYSRYLNLKSGNQEILWTPNS